MQLVVSAGAIAAIVFWGLLSPATLGSFFNSALVRITAEDARERHLHKALREWVRQQDAAAGVDTARTAAQPAAQVPPKTPM